MIVARPREPHESFCRMCGTRLKVTPLCEEWTRIPLAEYLLSVWRELAWRFKWAVGWRPLPLTRNKEVQP